MAYFTIDGAHIEVPDEEVLSYVLNYGDREWITEERIRISLEQVKEKIKKDYPDYTIIAIYQSNELRGVQLPREHKIEAIPTKYLNKEGV